MDPIAAIRASVAQAKFNHDEVSHWEADKLEEGVPWANCPECFRIHIDTLAEAIPESLSDAFVRILKEQPPKPTPASDGAQ